MESNPWVIETFYAILRLRLSPQMVSRMIRGSLSSSPSDAAYFEANPDMANYLAAAVSECLARSTRGAVDDIKAFRRASNLTVLGLNCPLTIWHGEDDVLAPLSDLLDYLGDLPKEVRVFPGIGHLLGIKHWDEMLRHFAQSESGPNT